MEATKWYYVQGGRTQGPVTLPVLVKLLAEGDLSENSPVSPHATDEWRPLRKVLGFLRFDVSQAADTAKPAAEEVIEADRVQLLI
jgi:hypothetical protein